MYVLAGSARSVRNRPRLAGTIALRTADYRIFVLAVGSVRVGGASIALFIVTRLGRRELGAFLDSWSEVRAFVRGMWMMGWRLRARIAVFGV